MLSKKQNVRIGSRREATLSCSEEGLRQDQLGTEQLPAGRVPFVHSAEAAGPAVLGVARRPGALCGDVQRDRSLGRPEGQGRSALAAQCGPARRTDQSVRVTSQPRSAPPRLPGRADGAAVMQPGPAAGPAFPLLPLRPPRPELSPVVLSGPQPARPALTPQGWDWSPSVLTTLLGGRRRNAWDSPVRPAPRPQACLPWKQALPAVPSLASLCSVSVGTALRALGPVASSCGRSQT